MLDFVNQVTWYLGNKKLVPDGTNISVTSEGTKRTLTIHDAQLKHIGEINARTNKDRSDAHLHVGILNEIISNVTSDSFRSEQKTRKYSGESLFRPGRSLEWFLPWKGRR